MWINISTIFTRLSHDPNVRAIVLTGAGDRAFTAGLDVKVPIPPPALLPKDSF
jgi:delta(3,5)-delta(2,4)-dienoyl-CoA isomerase